MPNPGSTNVKGECSGLDIFAYMEEHGHEQLVFCYDKASGLKAIIGIHDTTLGPALGGCRVWPYATEDEAIIDVLRLAKGMTYKNSAMGLNLGGGKTVVIGDPRGEKAEEKFRALGRFVEALNGRYITAEDVGVGTTEVTWVSHETEHVVGLPGKSGDPSPATAFGVFSGMQAAAEHVWGDQSLAGKTVAVQGLGNVGYNLCKHLHEAGAKLLVADIYEDRVQRVVAEFGATAVAPDRIHAADCDIYAPCALGAVINDESLPELKCRIVAGSANNQLAEPRHGDELHKRGILYAPDYIINGGGVINVAYELSGDGYNRERAYAHIATIYDRLQRVFNISREQDIPTYKAADVLAEQRIGAIGAVQRIRTGGK